MSGGGQGTPVLTALLLTALLGLLSASMVFDAWWAPPPPPLSIAAADDDQSVSLAHFGYLLYVRRQAAIVSARALARKDN